MDENTRFGDMTKEDKKELHANAVERTMQLEEPTVHNIATGSRILTEEEKKNCAENYKIIQAHEAEDLAAKAALLAAMPVWKKKPTSSHVEYLRPRLAPTQREEVKGYVKPELIDTRSNRDKLKDKKRAEKAAKIRHR